MTDLEITNICEKADKINNLLMPIDEDDRVKIVTNYLKDNNVRIETFLVYVLHKSKEVANTMFDKV